MSNKLTPGFAKADSNNLPCVNSSMIQNYFINNSKFVSAEVRHQKTKRATEEAYGDNAVCYVEVNRQNNLCTVQGKITPEHKIKKKPYMIKVVVDEKEESIISGECLDCVAAKGGCKHCIAFLLWMHRRSEEPSVTSTKCYWQGSKLSKADVVNDDYATILGKPITFAEPDMALVEGVVAALDGKSKQGVIFEFFKPSTNNGSIHNLRTNFLNSNMDKTAENFFQSIDSSMDEDITIKIEKNTRDQANSPLWFEMRYGRITASLIYEAARSKTFSGTLMEKILGAQPPLETEAVIRGKTLEPEVLNVVRKLKKLKISKAGLFVARNCAIFGASPDGITEEYVIEIKCPSTSKTLESYIKNGVISKKFYYQIQLQMMCANRNKGLFCVASPNFERTKEVEIVEVLYNREEILEIVDLAKTFWVKAIFEQLKSGFL